MGRALPEVTQKKGLGQGGGGRGECAHLLLGVHHWHPLEDTKGSVAHSHPALLPVGQWGGLGQRGLRGGPPRERDTSGDTPRCGGNALMEGALLLRGHS